MVQRPMLPGPPLVTQNLTEGMNSLLGIPKEPERYDCVKYHSKKN
jgi:hypothetical protein